MLFALNLSTFRASPRVKNLLDRLGWIGYVQVTQHWCLSFWMIGSRFQPFGGGVLPSGRPGAVARSVAVQNQTGMLSNIANNSQALDDAARFVSRLAFFRAAFTLQLHACMQACKQASKPPFSPLTSGPDQQNLLDFLQFPPRSTLPSLSSLRLIRFNSA